MRYIYKIYLLRYVKYIEINDWKYLDFLRVYFIVFFLFYFYLIIWLSVKDWFGVSLISII